MIVRQLAAKDGRGTPVQPLAMTRTERYTYISRYEVAIGQCGPVDIYWIPASRSLAFRSAHRVQRRPRAVHQSAVHLGRFDEGTTARQFVSDLDQLLFEGLGK